MDDASLTIKLCEILGTIPGWHWRPNGPAYTSSEVAIYYGAIPDETYRAAVGVRVYGDAEADGVLGRRVQLRFRSPRGARDGADKLAHPAWVVLTGLSRVGGISGARRRSFTPAGADGNGREERTDNYTITLDNTEAAS